MRARLLLVLLALLAGLAVVPAPAAEAGDTYRFAVITFSKNYRDTHRSTLSWQVFRRNADGSRTSLVRKEWRAGSGFTRTSTNACVRNDGWLPNGVYHPRLFSDYGGSVIKGRAIYLGQHRCGDGTMRQQLFIHTEQGAGSRQCPDAPGDQACRWEYPAVNDYRSYGCIKLSPADLRSLYDAWRRYFPLGAPERVRVEVR